MLKKKRTIYCMIFLIFFILISLYGINVYKVQQKDNLIRLENAAAISENSVRKSMEYQAKSILLECSNLNLENSKTPEEAAKLLKKNGKADMGYYIVNSEGKLVMPESFLNGKRLEITAFQLDNSVGYSVSGILNLQDNQHNVALVTPLNSDWNGYLALVYTGNDFVRLVTENITLSNVDVCLFDEWSNLVGSNTLSQDIKDNSAVESIRRGAEQFNYSQNNNAFQKISNENEYNVFFSTGIPQNWFFGAHVTQLTGSQGYLFNMPISSIFMFAVLMFLLIVMVSLDALNERETKKKISQAINIDHLTGLSNSLGMRENMISYINDTMATDHILVCLDIVAFSRINTMFGYAVGDTLLEVVGKVIQRNYLCGARINADSFVFLVPPTNCDCSKMERDFMTSIENNMGSQYIQMISFKFGTNPIGSIPIHFQEVYEGALLALKSAKKSSSTNEVSFDAELQESMEMLRNIEINMMHALSKEEFQVYVQPQINLSDESCHRGEALIRWNSEFMGFLPPDKFVPVFESNGFIVETDFYMLNEAMSLAQNRSKQGLPSIIIAVNQSKVTITFPNYYERLKHLISLYPDAPLNCIELEITESTLENDWGTIVPLIHNVKKLGFSIAMDDFGTGFSSLSTLRILPIDILKIDRGFLQECDNSQRCRVIIKNIIRLAKELNITIICEGVESQSQLDFLKDNQCDIVQGFFYSKPIPLQDFLDKYFGNDL